MNIWERKRKKAGLTTVELANELKINENIVKEVENGMRELPTSKVDEYLNVIDKTTKTERDLKIARAREWWENVDIEQQMKNFGIKSQRQLGEKISVSQGKISEWFSGKSRISDNGLLKMYFFFNNEFNKEIEPVNIKPKKDIYDKWYKNFDFNAFLKECCITQKQLAEDLELGQSTICRLKRKAPAYKSTLIKLYNYVQDKTNENTKKTQDENNEGLFFEMVGETNVSCDNQESLEEQVSKEMVAENDSVEIETNYEDYFQGPVIGITNEEEIENIRKDLSKAIQQIKRYETLIDMIVGKKEI